VQARLEGPDRDPEDARGLGIRQAQEVMDDEGGALLRRQPPERPLELVSRRQVVLEISRTRGVGSSHGDFHDHAATGPLRQSVAGVDEQAVEPRVEPLRVTDGSDVQPGREKRVLDRIGRVVVAAEDQPGGAMEAVGGGSSKGREGIMIAAPGADDEVSVHRVPAFGRGRVAALSHHESPGDPIVPSRERRPLLGVPSQRPGEWLRTIGESLREVDVPKEKADLLHAIYERITVAGLEKPIEDALGVVDCACAPTISCSWAACSRSGLSALRAASAEIGLGPVHPMPSSYNGASAS
jgi:hypothetical protein